jgi:hypothetical protein
VSALLLVGVLPFTASAQGSISITGVIRDTSGAVLPGVTVEATSPVLIEKVRTAVSDGTGQYRIVDLRPGIYALTFTLPGFNTLRREDIELSGNFTATINVELRVGAVEETVTVTGEAPTVDVQGVTRQQALSADIISAIPTGRNYTQLGVLIPGVIVECGSTCSAGSQDVGGTVGNSRATLTAHGSRFRDQRISINGVPIVGAVGGLMYTGPNMEAMQEVQVETGGVDASTNTGGVRTNVVPKEGGNTFSGSLFATGTNEDLQADNFSRELEDRGMTKEGMTRIKRLYDIAATFGGPIRRDRLWFFASFRRMENETYVSNLFRNANEYDATKWTYVKDTGRPVTTNSPITPAGLRLTWQATARNKIAGSFNLGAVCDCPNVASGTTSWEAAVDFVSTPDNTTLLSWTSPVSDRLLLDVTTVLLTNSWANRLHEGVTASTLTRVTSQNAPPGQPGTYRGASTFSATDRPFRSVVGSMTYVTGAHALKAGGNWTWGWAKPNFTATSPLTSIRINQATGLPNQFTVNSDPRQGHTRVPRDVGLYVQDRWTTGRMTLSGALRYDYIRQDAPELTLGPAPLLPTRNVTFPATVFKTFHDLSPRLGVAYDLFGTGKTAVKATLNRYVVDESLGSGTNTVQGSPQILFQYTMTRNWVDSNGNFFPDCDMGNPARQDLSGSGGDICQAATGTSANFGREIAGTVTDHDVVFGWGNRGYNWEFSTSVQQELVPGRFAVDVGYFRRWYGNFTVTDNFNVTAADYSPFSVQVPVDPRLPLSGQTISGFLDINPAKAGQPTDNHIQLAGKDEMWENWQGVDVMARVQLGGGTLVQGGLSTGRTVQDSCAALARLPESGITNQHYGIQDTLLIAIDAPLARPFCHQETPYLTQLKLLGTYTIPRVDVQLAGTFQSVPGPKITATHVYPNAVVAQSLNRNLSGGASNVTVNIIEAGSLYGDRLNQFDFRVGKIVRLPGNRRVTASVDLFNAFNSNAVLDEASTYSAFRTPTRVLTARMLKFSAALNF